MVKKVLLLSAVLVFMFGSFLDARLLCNNKKGISSNFTYKNKQYKTNLPLCELSESSQIDVNNSKLPKEISEIVGVGKRVLKKVDSAQSWELQSLTLNKYNYQHTTFWYYQLNFNASNQFYVYINVGLNGEEPEIYRIDEVLLTGRN